MIWILGGILQSGYSYLHDDMSSLLAVGVPNKRLFDIMHVMDVVLVIIFFSTLHWAIDGWQGLIIGSACFILANLIELVVALFFPLDEGGEMKSPRAKMHFNLVMVMSMLGMGRNACNVVSIKQYEWMGVVRYIFTGNVHCGCRHWIVGIKKCWK